MKRYPTWGVIILAIAIYANILLWIVALTGGFL